MLYAILKFIYKTGLWVFFRKFEVRNLKAIPEQGPLILVSNHPNTFMDPVVVASLLKQPLYFIAKSTVFGGPFINKMLHKMHLIPIHRREDAPDNPVNNEEAFAASFKALADGKSLIIYPEGNSFNERRLRKLKTGTARIALGAESTTLAGVKIVPIGLNYSAPTRFRSRVFVNVGEPIEVVDYLASYQTNPIETVNTLTDEIRIRLENLIIHTPSDEDDTLARNITTIHKDKLLIDDTETTLDQEKEFIRTKAIVNSIPYFKEKYPKRVFALKEKINFYMEQLQHLKLRDGVLVKDNQTLRRQAMLAGLYLILGLPVYLFGLVHNYIPYIIPSWVARRITKEEEWYAPIMLTAGIFTFPIFYSLEIWLFLKLVNPSVLWAAIYLLAIVLSGFFALSYWYTWRYTQEHWVLFAKSEQIVLKLKAMRQEIITELEWAQQEYLNQLNLKGEKIE